MPNNPPLKQRIRNGELTIGVSVPIMATRNRLEEILGKDEYAYVSVDSQHSAFNEERLVEFCAMAEELGIHVQFRIKHTRHTYLIGNLLDLGPCGVEVPQVETVATVAEAVNNFYYPQQGMRSWGGAARRSIKEYPDRLAYAAWWNDFGVLWMQIESINAASIARTFATPGVDCLSWGPADLAFNREANPDHPFQTDDDCLRYVLQQLDGTGVRLAYRNYDPALRNKYIDMGVMVLLEAAQ